MRGQRVMLASDLASLYEVTTGNLNLAVRRNALRFPPDFMFQLTRAEHATLRLRFASLEAGRGRHAKYLPYVFTEHGVAMLSSVLRSKRAILANIEIMRTFSRFRDVLTAHKDLARQLDALEGRCDRQFRVVFDTLRRLMTEPESRRRPIGFTT
ncbi:MAG TPA: ORF6N domain-containing protein [Gammaproteobacteria bacterium]